MKKKMLALCLLAVVLTALCATASAHKCSFGSWRVKRSATCTRTGLKFKYCVSCDHWEQSEIPRLPHEVAEWTITREPTCLREGGKEGMCSSCNNLVKYSIDKLEHSYGEMVVTKEPTCTAQGKGERVCSGCERKRILDIDKLGHDWETISVSKEPTCTAQGKGEQRCARCGAERTAKLNMIEHAWGEWTITQEPDGLTKGVKENACTVCGAKGRVRFYHEGTLYQDMEPCEEVIRLQQMLKDLGIYDGPIRSGSYGKQTGNAVGRFQKENGMERTEVADPATIEKIVSAWEAKTGKSDDAEMLNPAEMENAAEAQPALEG